jgi:biopolymer transport protein ExbD
MKSLKGLNSKRKKIETKDLDLAPMLSLMIAIIPVLLATSVILKIRIFDSSVFPASDKVMQSDGANERPITYIEITNSNKIKVEVKKVDKSVFETSTSLANLHQTLKSLKNKFPDMKSLKIESATEVSYKEIIQIFDMAKMPIKNDKNEAIGETLFEDVTLEDIFKG